MTRSLLHKDGTTVKIGDAVTSFRGEHFIVADWDRKGRNRVYVRPADASADDPDTADFYPSAFDLTWNDAAPVTPTGETVDITPSWSGVLRLLLTVYADGNDAGRRSALKELTRMAELADAYVASQKEPTQ